MINEPDLGSFLYNTPTQGGRMDPVYRTLLYRIHPGKTPYLVKMLKDPWHKKAIEEYNFPGLINLFRPRRFGVGLHIGHHGNYLFINCLAVKADELVDGLLKEKLALGKLLANNAHPPNREGVINTEIQNWYGGPRSVHLYEFPSDNEFPLGLFGQIGKLEGVAGLQVHYHYLKHEIVISLDLELTIFRTWLDVSAQLQSSQDNPAIFWLYKNTTPVAKNASNPLIKYVSST